MMTLSGSEQTLHHWGRLVTRHYATTHRQSAREGLNAKRRQPGSTSPIRNPPSSLDVPWRHRVACGGRDVANSEKERLAAEVADRWVDFRGALTPRYRSMRLQAHPHSLSPGDSTKNTSELYTLQTQ